MKSYNSQINKSFAGEILSMEPVEWLILAVLGLLLLLLVDLGLLQPLVASLERLSLGSRSKLYAISLDLGDTYQGLGNIRELSAENRQLKAENQALVSKLAEVDEIFAEHQRLLNETGIVYDREYRQIGVKVIGRDSSQPGLVVVNKGQKDGLKVNDIAVSENTLLGRVISITPFTAKVRLLVHPDSQVTVKTTTTSLGILVGEQGAGLKVEQILQSSAIAPGIKVYTSGLNGNFPPDLYVGEVLTVEADSRASTKQAILTSAVEWRELTSFKILSIPAV